MKMLFSDNYETFRRCEFYDSSRDAGCNDDVKTGIDVRNLKKYTPILIQLRNFRVKRQWQQCVPAKKTIAILMTNAVVLNLSSVVPVEIKTEEMGSNVPATRTMVKPGGALEDLPVSIMNMVYHYKHGFGLS